MQLHQLSRIVYPPAPLVVLSASWSSRIIRHPLVILPMSWGYLNKCSFNPYYSSWHNYDPRSSVIALLLTVCHAACFLALSGPMILFIVDCRARTAMRRGWWPLKTFCPRLSHEEQKQQQQQSMHSHTPDLAFTLAFAVLVITALVVSIVLVDCCVVRLHRANCWADFRYTSVLVCNVVVGERVNRTGNDLTLSRDLCCVNLLTLCSHLCNLPKLSKYEKVWD